MVSKSKAANIKKRSVLQERIIMDTICRIITVFFFSPNLGKIFPTNFDGENFSPHRVWGIFFPNFFLVIPEKKRCFLTDLRFQVSMGAGCSSAGSLDKLWPCKIYFSSLHGYWLGLPDDSCELQAEERVLVRLRPAGLGSISGAALGMPAPPECSKIYVFEGKNNGF